MDRLPTCFRLLGETLHKWMVEGPLSQEEITGVWDAQSQLEADCPRNSASIFNWQNNVGGDIAQAPVLKARLWPSSPDGTKHVMAAVSFTCTIRRRFHTVACD